MMIAVKIFITAMLLTAIETTIRWIWQAPTNWQRIRQAWTLLVFELAILIVWLALAIFDLRPPIDPIRIAASLWDRLSGR